MALSIDASLLTSYYAARAGVGTTSSGASSSSGGAAKVAPTAPWLSNQTALQTTDSVKGALQGQKFVNENAAQLDVTGASADYRKLFAMYQGLTTLSSVADQSQAKGLTSIDKQRLQETFERGMSEISGYVDTTAFDKLRMVQGDVSFQAKTTLPVAQPQPAYVTPTLVTGSSEDLPDAFQGNVHFTISVNRVKTVHNVDIDLSQMGSQPRSLANVVTYINQQLAADGLDTRVATQRTAGQPKTIQAGGKTVTLGPGADQWAMQVKVSVGETVSFSAPQTSSAVYLAQTVGDPNPDKIATTNDDATSRQLVKFQTDDGTADPPPQKTGDANWVDGRVSASTLGPEVKAVHATQVGPDGSVYVLADVNGTTDGQAIKGAQDVALIKYDSAGKMLFTRTLGAADTATGLALAVSADGKIAVAGSVTGTLDGSTDGALNSGATGTYADYSDSFVTEYDADGQELWTQRRGARQGDEASSVAFGADGSVYVAGRAQTQMPGETTPAGDWDSYIEGFKADAKGKVSTLFTQSFGTAEADRPAGMVVDGNALVTASLENGHAVLRRFDISAASPTQAPVQTGTQDLGDLQGGTLTGVALDGNGNVVVAGSTTNAALSGTITRANAGGMDAFVASFASDLSAPGQVAYYGGAGDDRATALTTSNGQVWIAGSAGTDLPDNPDPVGTKDGFLANIDVAAGTIDWSRRFTGATGRATPSAIAIDPTGASVLDRIGLPKGTLDLSDSQQLTAISSLRAGDQFTVRVGQGPASTVTIDAADTLDTLATKIQRASGFQAKVAIGTVAGVRSLTVTPSTPRTTVEFAAGKTDKDALALLGIPAGVVRSTTLVDGKTMPADGKGQLYGLGLPADLTLQTDVGYHHAVAEIAAAQGVIRQAYKDLVAAASPKTAQAAAKSASGPVPAYLTSQIANYQAALARLGGGS